MTRQEWCTALARLVSPAFAEEGQDALLAMLPAMAHLPDELFCDETLVVVAAAEAKQSVPSFREITTALGQHRARVAQSLRLAAPSNADLPPDRVGPLPEEVVSVANLLSAHRIEVAQREIERLEREPKSRLADVTLKGAALAQVRAARMQRVGSGVG